LDAIRKGQPQALFVDEFRTPISLATAALVLVQLAQSDLTGLIHVAGTERLSRHELIHRAAVALGLNAELIRPNRRADVSLPEPRPADVSLETSRLAALLPDLHRATIEEAVRGKFA
jgi:dTDP-4-dehydrorhamnose reductase